MAAKTQSAKRIFVRSLAMGVLLSIVTVYLFHVFGKWDAQSYRPDTQTTASLILTNKCAFLGGVHILRPGYPVSTMASSIDGTKLGGSFLNFYDGHFAAMIVCALLFGVLIFFVWNAKKLRKANYD